MAASPRILLVDDEALVLELVRDTLQGCGYTIDTANNSQEALAMIKNEAYSMLILDLLLPDMNGYLLAREIRRISPHLGKKILFISGILFGQSTMEHIGVIGAGFLSKPFRIDSLIEAVDKITNRRAAS